MNRGRKPLPQAELVEDDTDPKHLAIANQHANDAAAGDLLAIQQQELFKVVGRIEMADLVRNVSSRVMAQQYLRAKALIGELGSIPCVGADGRAKRVSSLDEFCSIHLHRSQRRCQQLVQDLEVLGEELHEKAELLGMKAREYANLRVLPPEEQELVKQAIAAGDKESVVDLLTELSIRHAATKKELADQKQETVAVRKVLERRDEKIARLEETAEAELHPETQALAELKTRVLTAQTGLMQLFALVKEFADQDLTEEFRSLINGDVEYLAQIFEQLLVQGGIPVNFQEMANPSWMRQGKAKGA